jgi:hypothetical protein
MENVMKTFNLISALVFAAPIYLQAKELPKTPYLGTEFTNGYQSGVVYARIYGHPDKALSPGESISVSALPTAGGIFNSPDKKPFEFISISMMNCSKPLCVLLSDTEIKNRMTGDKKSTKTEKDATPDFEIINGGHSNITVKRTGETSWLTIPPSASAKLTQINESGFSIGGEMSAIQIDQQKCNTRYCFRVLP